MPKKSQINEYSDDIKVKILVLINGDIGLPLSLPIMLIIGSRMVIVFWAWS